MNTEQKFFKKRILELADRAYSSLIPCFTPFMGLLEQDIFHSAEKEFSHVPHTLFGGAEGCGRVMARFGDKELIGYEAPFPIDCLRAEPLSEKFAEELTHRDILGAIMNLGVDRAAVGDIVMRSEGFYIFCTESISPHIRENLSRAKHTCLRVSRVSELPEGEMYKLQRKNINAASERADCVAAQLLKLGRSETAGLISQGKLFINGRLCEAGGKILKSGDIVSVRGAGRFIFRGVTGTTRKGRLIIAIDRYM